MPLAVLQYRMSESGSGKPISGTESAGKSFSCGDSTKRLHDFEYLWQQRWVNDRSEADIAAELDYTRPAVGYWLKKYGMGGRVHPYVRDGEILDDLYIRRDWSMAEICETFHVDKSTLAKYVKKHGCSKKVHRNAIGLKWAMPYIQREYYERERTLEAIADDLDCSCYGIIRVMELWGFDRRDRGEISGPEHSQWQGGVIEGYGTNWPEQRAKRLEKDGHRCVVCNSDASEFDRDLHVHHRTPRREFVDGDMNEANELSNLMSLCPSCHPKVERWPVQPH